MRNVNNAIAAGILMLASILPAHAQIIDFYIEGTVYATDDYFGPNPFGLEVGDTITASGSFDDTYIYGWGFEDVAVFDLNLSLGSATYTEHDAYWTPELTFLDGWVYSFYYDATDWSFYSNNDYFFGDFHNFDGYWHTFCATPQVAPVPVPAAVWLFGSGLLGLIGVARRKRTV